MLVLTCIMYAVLLCRLHSPNKDTRSNLVADVLMKVFAVNTLLEHAIDIVEQAKEIGLEQSIYSCNILLKCLAETSQRE